MEAYMMDCHCHLGDKDFINDIGEVLHNAKQAGVYGIVAVTEFPQDFQRVLDLADKYPDIILPCLGLHPVQEFSADGGFRSVALQDLNDVYSMIEDNYGRIGAVGEIGLDFTPRFIKKEEDKEIQRDVFRRQIELAKKYDLPVNVHSRSAGRPTITCLKEQGATKVLLHAFDGRASVAMEGVKEGYYFSIPPSAIHSPQKHKLIQALPMENILLETDSPALGPEKRVRNVPANLIMSCELIAQIKKIDIKDVKRQTTENAVKLFPKLKTFVQV